MPTRGGMSWSLAPKGSLPSRRAQVCTWRGTAVRPESPLEPTLPSYSRRLRTPLTPGRLSSVRPRVRPRVLTRIDNVPSPAK